MRIKLIASAAIALATLVPAVPALAQKSAYPSRTVTIVLPYPAGGSMDALARPMAEKLSQLWGQPVVVDNRTGANGIIATQSVMRAEPDGYTILLHLTGYIQNAALYKKLPYDPFTDLAPVTQLGTQPMGLAVGKTSPYGSVAELMGAMKAKSANFSYASFGTGSTGHIFGELLRSQAQAEIPHVPYRGEGPMLLDLMTNRVSIGFVSAATAASRAKDGSLKILAVTGPQRLAAMPDVPTLAEAGLKGFELVGWYGFFVPRGTPTAVIDKIAQDARGVLTQPDIVARMGELVIQPTGTSPADFATLLRVDFAKWDRLVKQFNIELE